MNIYVQRGGAWGWRWKVATDPDFTWGRGFVGSGQALTKWGAKHEARKQLRRYEKAQRDPEFYRWKEVAE